MSANANTVVVRVESDDAVRLLKFEAAGPYGFHLAVLDTKQTHKIAFILQTDGTDQPERTLTLYSDGTWHMQVPVSLDNVEDKP